MDAWVWILIGAIVLAVIAAVVIVVMQQRRRRELRESFGPEYDRAVAREGDVRRGESELIARRERRADFDIRPLSPPPGPPTHGAGSRRRLASSTTRRRRWRRRTHSSSR